MLCSRAASQKKQELAAPLLPTCRAVAHEGEDPDPVKGHRTGRWFERVSRSFWALSGRVFERFARPTIGVEEAIEDEHRNEL